jgi:hypothetical protein
MCPPGRILRAFASPCTYIWMVCGGIAFGGAYCCFRKACAVAAGRCHRDRVCAVASTRAMTCLSSIAASPGATHFRLKRSMALPLSVRAAAQAVFHLSATTRCTADRMRSTSCLGVRLARVGAAAHRSRSSLMTYSCDSPLRNHNIKKLRQAKVPKWPKKPPKGRGAAEILQVNAKETAENGGKWAKKLRQAQIPRFLNGESRLYPLDATPADR